MAWLSRLDCESWDAFPAGHVQFNLMPELTEENSGRIADNELTITIHLTADSGPFCAHTVRPIPPGHVQFNSVS
jgi:hypothetical protein